MSEKEKQELIWDLIDALSRLPRDQQEKAMHELIADVIRLLPAPVVRAIRDEIARDVNPQIPIVQSTLNLLDGHLALREMGVITP